MSTQDGDFSEDVMNGLAIVMYYAFWVIVPLAFLWLLFLLVVAAFEGVWGPLAIIASGFTAIILLRVIGRHEREKGRI